MSQLTRLALIAAAVCALGAMTATGAAASLPAVYQCGAAVKVGKPAKYTGEYEKGCKVKNSKHEGKYELEEWRVGSKETGGKKGKVKEFKGKTKEGANLEVVGENGIACAGGAEDKGKFTGPKIGELSVVFKGCETQGLKCTNTSTSGEVKTNLLEAEVGYISGKGTEHPVVGTVVRPKAPNSYLAVFHCSELNIQVYGSVIGEILPVDVNVFTKEATFKFEQAAGKQKYEKFEGGVTDKLFTEECLNVACKGEEKGSPSAEEVKIVNKGEELELKA